MSFAAVLQTLEDREDFTDQEEISRGNEANALLQSEVFAEALNRARLRCVERMLNTEAEEDAVRLSAWAQYHALEEFGAQVRKIADAGEIAKMRLEAAEG
jgi:hypothetical protein